MNYYELLYPSYYDKYLIDIESLGDDSLIEYFLTLFDAHRLSMEAIALLVGNGNKRYDEMKPHFNLFEDEIMDLTSIKSNILLRI